MFCPKCATQNADDARFCRGCGANVSLIPAVLNGELPEALEAGGKTISKKRRHKKSKPSVADGVRQLFVGLGFLFVAIILAFQNQPWWVWMLIPAFSILGNGASMVVRARY